MAGNTREAPTMTIIAYTRCSTMEQQESGAGLAAQRAAIEAELAKRSWGSQVVWIEDAGWSAKSIMRPGPTRALEMLSNGEATMLLASKMDRISRSVGDFAGLVASAQREGWMLVALDCPADPTTPMGEAMVNVMATFSQLERRLIGQRTKEALAQRRAAGVVLGRPRLVTDEVAELARSLRADGLTLSGVGAGLSGAGHVPPNGTTWHPSTLHRLLRRETQESFAA